MIPIPLDKNPRRSILNITNVHVDITDWRGTRGFIGDNEALTQLSDSLRARRMHNVAGPAGLLTHHAVMDEPSWHFLERLFALTGEYQHVRWLSAPEAFNLAP